MAKSIGKKGNFGLITTQLLEETIAGKKRNAQGELKLSRAGKRALATNHGRALFGLGSRVVTKTALKTTKGLRDIDLERIVRNSGSRLISYHEGAGFRFSKHDSNVTGRLHRFLYNGVKHLTAMKKKNALVPVKFSQKIQASISDNVAQMSEHLSDVGVDTLQRYARTLGRVVDLQMSHYAKGSGKRNMKLDNLIRVSTVVDTILEDLQHKARIHGDAIHCDYMDMMEEWITDLEKYKGHQNVNDFLRKIYKTVLEQKGEENRKANIYPQTVDELMHVVATIKRGVIEENKKHNFQCNISGTFVLQHALYQGLLDKVTDLPLPISDQVAKQVLQALNELRDAIGMSPTLEIGDVFAEGTVLQGAGKTKVGAQNVIARSYANCIQVITSRMKGDYKAKTDIREALEQVSAYFPDMSSFMNFTDAVQSYISSGADFKVQDAIEKKKNIGTNFEGNTYFTRNALHSVIDYLKDMHDPSKQNLCTVLSNIEEKLQSTIDGQKTAQVTTKIQDVISKDHTDKSRVRMKRFAKGVYNVVFGKTLVGQAVRTAAKLGVITTGGVMTGLTVPGVLMSPGGNILLQTIHMLEMKKLGICLGITAAGVLPWLLSPLRRDASNRSVRKLNTLKHKGVGQRKAGFFGDVQNKGNVVKEESRRIDAYNKRPPVLSESARALYSTYQGIQKEFTKSQHDNKGLINVRPEVMQELCDLGNAVQKEIKGAKKGDNASVGALRQVQRELLFMSQLQEVEAELTRQREQGMLYHDHTQYRWNTAQYPSEQIPRKDLAVLSGLYIISHALGDFRGKTRYQANFAYDENLLKERLTPRIGTVSDPKVLVSALDEKRQSYIKCLLETIRDEFPEDYNKSEFMKEISEALKTTPPAEWALQQHGGYDVAASQVYPSPSVSSIASAPMYTAPYKRLEEITDRDIYDAMENGTFPELINNSLLFYDPHTAEPLTKEGLSAVYSRLEKLHPSVAAQYKGSFFTETVCSMLGANQYAPEYKEAVKWILDTVLVAPKDFSKLKRGVHLSRQLIEQSNNTMMKSTRNPDRVLLGQIRLLANSIVSQQQKGTHKRTGIETVPSSESIPSSIMSDASTNVEGASSDGMAISFVKTLEEAMQKGTPGVLLNEELLEYALGNGRLGELARALVYATLPKNKKKVMDPAWITSLYASLDGLKEKYKAPLYGLVTGEIDIQILEQIKFPKPGLAVLARSVTQHVFARTKKGDVLFLPWITFNKNDVSNLESPNPAWLSDDIKTTLKDRLVNYLVKEESEALYLISQAGVHAGHAVNQQAAEWAQRLNRLGDLAYMMVKNSIPADRAERMETGWITSLYQCIRSLPKECQSDLLGLVAVEIDRQFLSQIQDNNMGRAVSTRGLLQHISESIPLDQHITFKDNVFFNKEHVKKQNNAAEIWSRDNPKSAFKNRLEDYLKLGLTTAPPLVPRASTPEIKMSSVKPSMPVVVNERSQQSSPSEIIPPLPQTHKVVESPTAVPTLAKIMKDSLQQKQEKAGVNEPLTERIPSPLLPEDILPLDVKEMLEKSMIKEQEVLLRLYKNVKKQYDYIMNSGMLTTNSGKVEDIDNTLLIITTSVMLDSMQQWGNLPDNYSIFRANAELLSDIDSMLNTIKKELIGTLLFVGVKDSVRNGEKKPVYAKGSTLLLNSSQFKAYMTDFIRAANESNLNEKTPLISKALSSQLMSFANGIFLMNQERKRREELLSSQSEEKRIKLSSTQLEFSDLIQSIFVKERELRNTLEFGLDTKE